MSLSYLTKKPKITIGIIANCLNNDNREALINELGTPKDGLFQPLKFSFKKSKGHILPLDFYSHDIGIPSVRRKAALAMNVAVGKLLNDGAKVICFTASTKRLPGKNGAKIPEHFQGKAVYSIGDNATTISFLTTLTNSLKDLQPNDEIVVLGYGFLGSEAVKKILQLKDPSKLTVVSEQLLKLPEEVKRVHDLAGITQRVKLLVVCTHLHADKISQTDLERILASEAVIIDVSAPPGISKEVINSLNPRPKRFSAGDFMIPEINYDFEPAILGFPSREFFYGCFTEALILGIFAEEMKISKDEYDFFNINDKAMALLKGKIEKIRATVPEIDFFE
jgi:hypothetical protein